MKMRTVLLVAVLVLTVGGVTTAGAAFVAIEAQKPALDMRPTISSNTQQST